MRGRGASELVGRTQDLALLTRRIDDGALLCTVTGPAGVGKTALVAHFAERLAERPGSDSAEVALVALSEARDLQGLCVAVAHALEISLLEVDDDQVTAARLGEALSVRPTLLVLDGFDALVRLSAGVVGGWLAQAPELQIVVTSRERLRLPGELVHELGPLSLPRADADLEQSEAVLLWNARMRAVNPTYSIKDADRPVVARLLRELDGLPLAIELAAGRCTVLGPATLLARLSDRFELLARGPRGTEPRQATLRGAIDASWELLTEAERAALAQCSVFRGGISLGAADAVLDLSGAGEPASPLSVIESLRDKSLLQAAADPAPGEQRLSLYQSIREYAEEKLSQRPEAEAVRQRHSAFFLLHAVQLRSYVTGPEAAQAIGRLSLERDNVLAAIDRSLADPSPSIGDLETALRCLVALEPLVLAEGPPSVFVGRLTRALAAHGAAEIAPALRARALTLRGRAAARAAGADARTRDLELAISLAAEGGDPRTEGVALCALASAHTAAGRLDEAVAAADRALSMARDTNDRALAGVAEQSLGDACRERGDAETARRHIERALDLFRDSRDVMHELRALIELSHLHVDAGRRELAEMFAERALAAGESLAMQSGWLDPALLAVLARLAHEAGRLDEALERYRAAQEAARSRGDPRTEASCAVCAALARIEQGAVSDGWMSLRDALPAVRRTCGPRYAAVATAALGAAEAMLGRIDDARELVADAYEALRDAGAGVHAGAVAMCRDWVERMAGAEPAPRAAPEDAAPAGDARIGPLQFEARILRRLLARASCGEPEAASSVRAGAGLELDAEGKWFTPPGGSRVDCDRRPVMRRMLLALARARLDRPGRTLTSDELLAAGWPSERMGREAGRNRVRVMVSRIRDLGLRDVLLAVEDGYLIDAAVAVRLVG